MAGGGKKAIIAALLANLGIAVAKFVGFFITGASSMLAEAIHSCADSGNQGLLLFGAARSEQAPDAEHHFGFGRERYFWSFIVALVIIALGSVFAIYEGIHKLLEPEPLKSPLVAVAILLVGILLEGWSFLTAIKEADKLRGQSSWWHFIRSTKHAELPVVLLEDLGALIGLVLALAGIGLATLTQNPRFDAIGTLSIGILLGVIAFILASEMKSLLIGESAKKEVILLIETQISETPSVSRLIHLRTQHLGPEELLIAAKVSLAADLDVPGVAQTINAIEARVRKEVPSARYIFIEPDLFKPDLLESTSA